MSFQRIFSVAACAIVGFASSLPANAQSLTIPMTASAASIDQHASYLPDYAVATSDPRASKPLARRDTDALFALATPALDTQISAEVASQVIFRSPRKRIADFAMRFRDVRYVRGGHDPKTGFDCSGFTHYVYLQTYGLNLPYDAPSQYRDGKSIARNRMRTGDLVFFQVGKHITHVGIYLEDGRFIHSPSPGKRVRIDSLDSAYWAIRFAGAKRPEVVS